MKKALIIFILIFFISILGYVGYGIVVKINHKNEIAENIKNIPSFNYETIEGFNFTNNDLKKSPSIFIYFNSECDFCNEEAKMIKENIDKFKNTQILFVSFEEKEKIKQFATQHKLLDYDNVSFLCDSKATFATTFDVKSLPCLVLYDENNILIDKIKGQIKADVLLKKMNLE